MSRFFKISRILTLTVLVTLFFSAGIIKSFFPIGQRVFVADSNVQEGSIVSYKDGEYSLTRNEYDPSMVGVVGSEEGIYVEQVDSLGHIIMSDGLVLVLVSDENGEIKKGDFITSSQSPGIGMKAEKQGFMVGKALSDYDPDGETIQQVEAILEVKFSSPNDSLAVEKFEEDTSSFFPQLSKSLIQIVHASAENAASDPNKGVLYLLAGFILVVATIFGYFTFGRIALGGINALGRNPLAKNVILIGVIINTLLTLVVVIVALFAAYFLVTV